MWDFSIDTDHVIEAWRPDLVVVDKEGSCEITGFAVPGDTRIEEKEKDKVEKYQDLGKELQKIWNVKVKIIPLAWEYFSIIGRESNYYLSETKESLFIKRDNPSLNRNKYSQELFLF